MGTRANPPASGEGSYTHIVIKPSQCARSGLFFVGVNVLKLGLASTFHCGVRVAPCDRALRYMRVNGDAAPTIYDKGQTNRHLDIETSQLHV